MKRGAVVALLLAAGPVHAASPQAPCAFDSATLSFEGTPVAQAECLLRHVGKGGVLGPRLAKLPPHLRKLVGQVPSVRSDRLAQRMQAAGLPPDTLALPVSRANDNDPAAPSARYLVIHDTSSPFLGDKPFPPGIDRDPALAPMDRFLGPNAVAHVFNARNGTLTIGHDFAVPWRATKREKAIGLPAKGLFLHIENVQPRRSDPAGKPGNDLVAPVPGLTAAQYDSLALLYIVASVRAHRWLVPAFHAALDIGIPDAHDDPQNFELAAFDRAIGRQLRALR